MCRRQTRTCPSHTRGSRSLPPSRKVGSAAGAASPASTGHRRDRRGPARKHLASVVPPHPELPPSRLDFWFARWENSIACYIAPWARRVTEMLTQNPWMWVVAWVIVSSALTGAWTLTTPAYLDVLPAATPVRLGIVLAATGVPLTAGAVGVARRAKRVERPEP